MVQSHGSTLTIPVQPELGYIRHWNAAELQLGREPEIPVFVSFGICLQSLGLSFMAHPNTPRCWNVFHSRYGWIGFLRTAGDGYRVEDCTGYESRFDNIWAATTFLLDACDDVNWQCWLEVCCE